MLPLIHIGPVTIATYGLMVWCGIAAGYLSLRAECRRLRLPVDPAAMILAIAAAGIVGGKVWHVLESPGRLLLHPAGFAWFGAAIGGLLAIAALARFHHVRLRSVLDACCPGAAIGYAIGRIGCLLSGDGDYGPPTSLPWGMRFPNGLVPTTDPVHPTPIYECLAGLGLFLYLKYLGRRESRAGIVTLRYFQLHGATRFLVEWLRTNPPVLFGFSTAQWAALVFFGVGCWGARPSARHAHTRGTEPRS
jgi:phosphatidylglycerol:prolipoprotein diacylglycerol transferase